MGAAARRWRYPSRVPGQPILIGQTPPWTIGPIGEAFPVDLGSKGTFFVLLSTDRSRRASVSAGIARFIPISNSGISMDRSRPCSPSSSLSGKAILPWDIRPAQLPMLVRFRDLNDPKSIEIVDPDHLDSSFGRE